MNEITGHNTPCILTLLTILTSIGLFVSVTTTILCVILGYRRRELLKMTIFRVITALQLLEVFDSIFNLLTLYVNPSRNANCRVLVFFSLVLAISPLVLSVFCILYFQIILIHNIPLRRKWPRIMMATGSVAVSLVPPMFTLFIPAETAGINSYCDYLAAPNSRLFVFKWLVFYIWATLAIFAGIFSMLTMLTFITRRSRAASCHLSLDGFGHLDDTNTESTLLNANVVSDVIKDNRNKRRQSHTRVVIQTLRSVIWFPIAPIVCLGFNTVYSIVWYRTKRENNVIFVIDRVLQFLAVPLIAMTFYLSPPVKRAFKQCVLDRKLRTAGNGHKWHSYEDNRYCMGRRRTSYQKTKISSEQQNHSILRSRSHQIQDQQSFLRHRQRRASSLPLHDNNRSSSHSPASSTLHSRKNSRQKD
ncbi:hypothetical protein J3B02_000746 [Coemansia erecta]|nr:hypothetical protein J3B02_000746 [Coemansia erecta]